MEEVNPVVPHEIAADDGRDVPFVVQAFKFPPESPTKRYFALVATSVARDLTGLVPRGGFTQVLVPDST